MGDNLDVRTVTTNPTANLTNEDGGEDSIEGQPRKRVQSKPNFFQRLIGCCLGRSSQTKSRSSSQENPSELSDSDDDDESAAKRNHKDDFDSPQLSLAQNLKFNEKDKRRVRKKLSSEEENNASQKNSNRNSSKKDQKKKKIGTSNVQTDGSSSSSMRSVYIPPKFRGSSFSTKTHNYDFDISNFNVDSIFLFGKQLQLIILITEQRYAIDYATCAQENVELEASGYSLGFSSSKSHERDLKYFQRRLVYFSRFNRGIQVDMNAWQVLIPECIVLHIARKAASSARRDSIVDASCCVGQFAIAFAKYVNTVIAIEKNPERMTCARINAKVNEVVNCKYIQGERLMFNEGILFYSDAAFAEPSFEVFANLSDCVFIAPQLLTSNVDRKGSRKETCYYESSEFYDELRFLLRKAFRIAPQVILLTPRNVKIAEVCDAFTEALKENLSTVKRCSMQIEKYFINDHLKYICFYFGDFNKSSNELSFQGEFKFINSYLERCYTIASPQKQKNRNKNKLPITSTVQQQQYQSISGSSMIGRSYKPIHIHQQVFNELGKFQLLNIVCRFNQNFKNENLNISDSNPLLNQFYDYLVFHNFMSPERMKYILSQKMNTHSHVSSNTTRQFNLVSEIRNENNNNSELRFNGSHLIPGSRSNSNFQNNNNNNSNNATSSQIQIKQRRGQSLKSSFLQQYLFRGIVDLPCNSDSPSVDDETSMMKRGKSMNALQQPQQIRGGIIDHRLDLQTPPMNQSLDQAFSQGSALPEVRTVPFDSRLDSRDGSDMFFESEVPEQLPKNLVKGSINPGKTSFVSVNRSSRRESSCEAKLQQTNEQEKGNEREQSLFSETESEVEYCEEWSFKQNNQLNLSANTHKVSFLAKHAKADSRVEDFSRTELMFKKSQLSSASAWSNHEQHEIVVVFHSTFFESSLIEQESINDGLLEEIPSRGNSNQTNEPSGVKQTNSL